MDELTLTSERIEEFLGRLPRDEGRKTRSRLPDLHRIVGAGLPASAIGHIERRLQISASEVSRLLAISGSSRKRLKQSPRKRLDPSASDRLIRLASTLADAADVFGDSSKAVGWFKSPCVALGGTSPLELMTSDPGARRVREELGRIRFGHWA